MVRILPLLFPAGLLLAAAMTPVAAEESPARVLEPVRVVERVPPVRLVFDCERRALPHQRLVGETLGLHNLGQVYDARARLMAEVGRACQRPGAERVGLVLMDAAVRTRSADRRAARQQQSLPAQAGLASVRTPDNPR